MTVEEQARPLVLVGAGGLARETVQAVWAGAGGGRLEPVGYLDDDPALSGTRISALEVLGSTGLIDGLNLSTMFLATVGSPRDPWRRRRLTDRLDLPDHRWATVVHPSAQLAASTVVGPGALILAGCITTADVWIGAHVVLMPGCILTHDDVLADHVTVASGVRLSGGVRVGPAAYLGAGALVREGISIGAGAVIGMGAVVTRDVPDHETWVGVPARRLRSAG